ncbi:hypothetical protein Q1M64_00810 (plasmid) [Sinorhizobium meliloti]|nr:hypothetical protein Q1M63_08010 [Sinorhizobium meliloti]WKL39606.1 hypothetical protein Q1M64_00810 [Sinorhizobium meliloti]
MQEETGLAYASKIANRMHACGHDLHTATVPCRRRRVEAPGGPAGRQRPPHLSAGGGSRRRREGNDCRRGDGRR